MDGYPTKGQGSVPGLRRLRAPSPATATEAAEGTESLPEHEVDAGWWRAGCWSGRHHEQDADLLARRAPQTHKRWMLVATIALLPPALGRSPLPAAVFRMGVP